MSQLQVTGEAKIRDIQGPVIANSGVITALDGAASQYVRGDGTLASFPSSSGGGSSVSYYLNGSVNQGTFGGSTYYQMSKNAIVGTGTNFSTSANGLIAQFITDANDPDVVSIPSGNWNIEFFMSVSASSGALASFYVEIYKYNGSTFTLLATNVATPEQLTNTTTVDAYFTSVAMPLSAMAVTDRLAVRVFANVASKTVTLYTEDNRLCQIVTTFSKGMLSLNNLTDQSQYLTTGTSGTDFNIVSSGDTHTFNLPIASATNTGKLSSTDWSTFNAKQPAGNYVTLDTTQTITAAKTFSLDILVNGLTIGRGAGAIASNTAIGISALSANTTGIRNIAIGENALLTNTTGFNNIAIGPNALSLNSTGLSNIAIGNRALENSTGGGGNTAVGSLSLSGITTGQGNIAIGLSAGFIITTGSNNTIIGNFAGTSAMANNIVLADGAGNVRYRYDGTNNNLYGNVNFSSTIGNGTYTYTLPNATGTIALTSQLTSGTVTSVGLSSATSGVTIGSSPISTSGTITLAIATASGSQNGLLSSTDWTTFNNKLSTAAAAATYVPYTGATTNVNLGVYNLTANQVIVGGAGVNNAGTFTTYDGGVATQLIGSTGNLKFFPFWNPSIGARINAENSAGSAYIPLSLYASVINLGGALSGTSATFSGSGSFGSAAMSSARLTITDGTSIAAYWKATNTNAATRDWTIITNNNNFGDFAIRQGNSQGADATTGTDRLFISSTGAATFSSSVTATGAFISSMGNSAQIFLSNSATTGFQYATISNTGANLNFGIERSTGGALSNGSLAYASLIQTSNSTALQFGTNNNIRATIDASGNVGIGTSSPVNYTNYRSLHISGAASNSSAILYLTNSTESIRGLFYAEGSSSIVTIGSQSNHPFSFVTNDIERMRITSAGNVLINTTTVATAYKLKVENAGSGGIMAAASGTGDANFLSTSSSIGYHYYADNGTSARFYVLNNGDVRNANNSYGAISDIKLKENITDASPKLKDLLKVKVRNYNLIDDETKTKQIGVIAQELEEIFPNMITEDKLIDSDETIKTVKYSVFVPMLIKAVQELTQKVNELESKIK